MFNVKEIDIVHIVCYSLFLLGSLLKKTTAMFKRKCWIEIEQKVLTNINTNIRRGSWLVKPVTFNNLNSLSFWNLYLLRILPAFPKTLNIDTDKKRIYKSENNKLSVMYKRIPPRRLLSKASWSWSNVNFGSRRQFLNFTSFMIV